MKGPKRLQCCCCGRVAVGRQWWNRDTGYGICRRCGEDWEEKFGKEEAEYSCGVKGKHWAIPETTDSW